MSPKSVTGVIFFVMLVHLVISLLVVQRYPAPIPTFHQFDQQLLNYPFVMRGEYKGSGSPIEDIAPAEIALNAPWVMEQQISVYKNAKPLYLLLSALPASIFGVSFYTLRMGGIAVLICAVVLLFDLLRRIKGRTAGLIGVVAFSCAPIAWQSILIPAPFLAIICGVLLCLWSVWNSQFFTVRWASTLTGISLGILPFWGETAGDSIPALLVCIPMVFCYGLVAGWKKTQRKSCWHCVVPCEWLDSSSSSLVGISILGLCGTGGSGQYYFLGYSLGWIVQSDL